MRRRQFLSGSGCGLAALLRAFSPAARTRTAPSMSQREIAADVVIVGGGLGGCAAALAVLRSGRTAILTELTDWIGGQLTSQGVPPDEHPWIERFGASASYRKLRHEIRDHYRRHYSLTAEARANERLNPGNGSVSALCHEPRAALAALTALLAPFASSRKLLILLEHEPIAAAMQGDRVQSVMVRDRATLTERVLLAPYFLDATELGDLLPLTGAEFVTGAEGHAEHGEPHAPAEASPDDQQSFTCCFAVDYLDAQDHTIERPADYAFWREFVPALKRAWPGRLLDLNYSDPVTLKSASRGFDPRGTGIDISSLPFQIPLGALIPRRVENLLPACKNLGTTHITNGCFRLHPVEWGIGEAAGALAAFCLEHRQTPRSVRSTPKHLAAFQASLGAQGVEIAWPRLSPR